MNWPREKLAAWGAATGLHVLALALLASAGFAPRVSDVPEPDAPAPVIVEIVELIVPEPEIESEPPAPDVQPEPDPEPTPSPSPRRPEAPITAITQSRTEDARLAPPPTQPRQTAPQPRAPRDGTALSDGPPYPETPPPPLQRALRAMGCARFSPSQRVNCPTDEMEDEFISALAAEARGAAPIYDPVWDVYQAKTLLDRMAASPGGPGMYSRAENVAPVMSGGLGGTAASGVATQLNSNPDPVFDGGRYESWNEDAGAPGR